MEKNLYESGVSDEVTIYEELDGIASAHLATAGIPYRHESYADPPDKYAVFSVISDVEASHFAGQNRRTDYRVQLDLVFPKGDRAGLHAAYLALQTVLKAGGARPQGNIRMQDAEDGRSYIQKDYMITIWGDT